MIPFKYGSVVSGNDFCGRKQLIKELRELIASGQNIVLQGERRIGKTSLIHEVIRSQKGTRGLYLDILGTKTVDDLCLTMLRGIVSLEKKGSFVDRVIKSFAHIRPQLGMDYTGSLTLTFNSSAPLKIDSIQEIMNIIEAMHKRKPLIVVLDEFQDILQIKDAKTILAQLRSQIQFHSKIPYIFAGSNRNQMDQIFTSPDSPFYKSAIPLTVESLSFEEFAPFLTKRFKSGERNIEEGILKRVFEIADNIPGDIQQLCEGLWSVTSPGDDIKTETLNKAIRLIFSREQKSYEIIISRLTSNQIKVLNALALIGGESPASAKFVNTAGVKNASVVKQALDSLASQKILYQRDREWKYSNPYFKAWILSRFVVGR